MYVQNVGSSVRDNMAKVILTLRIMPENADVDIDRLVEKIKQNVPVDKIEKEPIAFGLVALKVTTLVEDAEGASEKIENKIKSIQGVGQVETVEVSRIYI